MDEEKRTLKRYSIDARSSLGVGNGDPDDVKAHVARAGGRVCCICQDPGHFAKVYPERLKGIRCHWCGEFGYKEVRCPVKEFQKENSETSKEHCSAYFAIGVTMRDSVFHQPGNWSERFVEVFLELFDSGSARIGDLV